MCREEAVQLHLSTPRLWKQLSFSTILQIFTERYNRTFASKWTNRNTYQDSDLTQPLPCFSNDFIFMFSSLCLVLKNWFEPVSLGFCIPALHRSGLAKIKLWLNYKKRTYLMISSRLCERILRASQTSIPLSGFLLKQICIGGTWPKRRRRSFAVVVLPVRLLVLPFEKGTNVPVIPCHICGFKGQPCVLTSLNKNTH